MALSIQEDIGTQGLTQPLRKPGSGVGHLSSLVLKEAQWWECSSSHPHQPAAPYCGNQSSHPHASVSFVLCRRCLLCESLAWGLVRRFSLESACCTNRKTHSDLNTHMKAGHSICRTPERLDGDRWTPGAHW